MSSAAARTTTTSKGVFDFAGARATGMGARAACCDGALAVLFPPISFAAHVERSSACDELVFSALPSKSSEATFSWWMRSPKGSISTLVRSAQSPFSSCGSSGAGTIGALDLEMGRVELGHLRGRLILILDAFPDLEV